MTRATIAWLTLLGLAIGSISEACAQARQAPEDRWEAIGKPMTDLLQEGYRLVSVVAPSPQLRIFFLSKDGMVAKCTEEATQPPPPPPPVAGPKGKPLIDPRDYARGIESKIECSRLSKSR
jgi:hypothetical protein